MSAYPKLSMKSPHITGFSINSACRFGHSASPDDFRVSLLVSFVLLPNLSPDSPGIRFPVLHHILQRPLAFPSDQNYYVVYRSLGSKRGNQYDRRKRQRDGARFIGTGILRIRQTPMLNDKLVAVVM